jgi:hypothetical protein
MVVADAQTGGRCTIPLVRREKRVIDQNNHSSPRVKRFFLPVHFYSVAENDTSHACQKAAQATPLTHARKG